MSDFSKHQLTLPPEQQAIRDQCYHPSGNFVEFPIEEIEQSIQNLFKTPPAVVAKLKEVLK